MGQRQHYNLVPDLISKYNLKTFVETGCHIGMGLAYAKEHGMTRFYSCDIFQDMVDQARNNVPEALILTTDSLSFMADILTILKDEQVLFFLDAHFPSMYGDVNTENESNRIPMFDELKLIAASGRTKDIIFCDDARCLADPENPAYDANMPEHLRLNMSYKDFVAPMQATHDVVVSPLDTGAIVFIPKE